MKFISRFLNDLLKSALSICYWSSRLIFFLARYNFNVSVFNHKKKLLHPLLLRISCTIRSPIINTFQCNFLLHRRRSQSRLPCCSAKLKLRNTLIKLLFQFRCVWQINTTKRRALIKWCNGNLELVPIP